MANLVVVEEEEDVLQRFAVGGRRWCRPESLVQFSSSSLPGSPADETGLPFGALIAALAEPGDCVGRRGKEKLEVEKFLENVDKCVHDAGDEMQQAELPDRCEEWGGMRIRCAGYTVADGNASFANRGTRISPMEQG